VDLGGYRFLEHVSDIFVEVWGESLEEVFVQAAVAFYGVMLDFSSIRPVIKREVSIEGYDTHSLLYNWIESLIALFDIEGLIFSQFDVKIVEGDGFTLKGTIKGERYDAERHSPKIEVKAITYHAMSFERKGEKYYATYLLDI
jgi:SHS2 domain-containing protein